MPGPIQVGGELLARWNLALSDLTRADDKRAKADKPRRYGPEDFTYDAAAGTCTCPAGKRLHRNGSGCVITKGARID